MPATIQDLKKVRQELITKTPLLYQGEIYENWTYTDDGTDLKDNNPIELKIALLKEAINIWDNKTYNLSNIQKAFKNTNTNVGNWEIILKRWLNLKNTLKLDDWDQKGYIERRRAMPTIYSDYDNEIKALEAEKTQALTDKAAAEASLKEYREKLGTETPEQLKANLTALTEAKTKAEGELTQYKEKLGSETPEQLKVKLDKLNEWQTAFPADKYPNGIESAKGAENQIREEAQGEIKKLNDQITKLNEQLTNKETVGTQNNETYLAIIKSYQDLINPWLTDLESKVKSEPLTQELLSIYRKETSYRLTLFYQEREIDDKIINQKYGGKSYETIVKQQLTLTNRRDMEDAFKVVTCICAYEKAEQMSNKLKEKGTHSEALIKPLLARLEKLKNTWLELPKTVKSENNPFYLPIIEDQSQPQAKVEQLITFWKQNKLENVQLQVGK
ncbi:MAG: hypothetical protein I3273_00755 [Candidatus Moeniiplasma glomeromycotorum]|nr:hypothetical protein [Candidatus Moeniiplasma glomeromycotorum]MCE8168640.1 hypothetical protein [Candidatus Moeniiplasma glomeromycotorum]